MMRQQHFAIALYSALSDIYSESLVCNARVHPSSKEELLTTLHEISQLRKFCHIHPGIFSIQTFDILYATGTLIYRDLARANSTGVLLNTTLKLLTNTMDIIHLEQELKNQVNKKHKRHYTPSTNTQECNLVYLQS